MVLLFLNTIIVALSLVALSFMAVFHLINRAINAKERQRGTRLDILEKTLKDKNDGKGAILGFFHPFAASGGGGERVLWSIIQAIQDNHKNYLCVVYIASSQYKDKTVLLQEVKENFGIELDPQSVHFIKLEKWNLVNKSYSVTRLLLQSIGSVILCDEAMNHLIPDAYLDTSGYAFTYPYVRYFFKVPVITYTHYPTISGDMIQAVRSREKKPDNGHSIANSTILTIMKEIYYKALYFVYGRSGACASLIVTNSSWCNNHILEAFKKPEATRIIYPPCDSTRMSKFSLQGDSRMKRKIISLAQFRPEKNQILQIEGFYKFMEMYRGKYFKDETSEQVEMLIIGGAKNESDFKRVEQYNKRIKELGLEKHVKIVVNASYGYVCKQLEEATIGVHTMKDEHFGINIIEFMASGAIPVAHDSAGPKMDIVIPAIKPDSGYEKENGDSLLLKDTTDSVGFLATTADEFAKAFDTIFSLPADVDLNIRKNARSRAVDIFGIEKFKSTFVEAFDATFLQFHHH